MTLLDTLNARAARWVRLLGSAAALAAMATGAHAGTVTFSSSLTNNGANSSCKYSAINETSAGNWTVTCSASGTNTITVSPALCGTVCNSYSSMGANSAGQWSVNGCVFSGGSATATITNPAAPISTINAGAPYTLQASASACAPATVAQVEFWGGVGSPSALLPGGTITTAPYNYVWTPTDATYTIVAKAKDSNGVYTTSAPVTIRANAAPTVSASVAPSAPRAAPASFTLTASASDSDGIASIQWMGTGLASPPTGASYAWNNAAAGTYTVFARATDGLGRSTDSAPVTVTVTSTNQVPTFTGVPAATPNGTSVTLTATATDSDGTIVRVEFVDTATNVVVATATAGPTYTAQWANPSTGSHTIVARAIDNSGGVTTSTSTTFTIVAPFRVTLTSAPTSSPYFVAPATVKFTMQPIPETKQLSQVTLYMDDVAQGTFGAGTTLGEWEKSISVPAGAHRFYARATGADGSTGTSNDTIVSVDGSGPPAAPNVCSAEPTVGIGATAGAASISESGASTYSIPIQVPPGINGVAPSVSLSYNSQGGNGLVGVGWSLQGFSTIQRCAANVFIDGVKGSVQYDANDSLCMDGQRLIRVPSFDASAVEYRTEHESYARIQAFNPFAPGIWAGAAAYFKVSTKSGLIMYYGWKQTEAAGPWDDAFLRTVPFPVAGRETGRVWGLYRIEDRVGNFARVFYENNQDLGTMRPSYVEYTGNASMGAAPFARVSFTYEPRPDATNAYLVGGQKSFEGYRLRSIVTRTDNADVKRYTLSYGTSALSGRSLLQSVQECSGDGVMCLAPTTFQWTDAEGGARTLAFGAPWNGASTGSNRDTTVAIDMDGDGKTDLVSRRDPQQSWDVCKSTGANYNCEIWVSGPRAQGSGRDDVWHFADFDGDGKGDVVFLSPDLSGVTLQLSTGSGFGPALRGFVSWPGASDPSGHPYAHTVGDFDGDGRADLALYMGNYLWVFCSYNGSSFNCTAPMTIPGPAQPSNSPNAGFDFLVADFNGDGRADLAFHVNNSNQWGICYSTSQIGAFSFDCASATTAAIVEDAYRVHIADVNGDGLADMVAPIEPRAASGDYTAWNVCLSRGDKTFDCNTWTGPNVSHDNASLGDFNGDGRTDVVWYKAGVGWRVCESTGSSFNCDSASRGFGVAPMDGLKNLRIADFNGDGKSDLAIWTSESSATWTVGLAGGSPTDLVRRATNGMGIAAAFTYKPLTDGTVYAKGSSAVYPEIDIQSPMYVVSRMETSTLAPQPWYGSDYSYRGLRGHAQGAGLSGFQSRIVVDSNTDNPGIGMCSETVTMTSWSDRRTGVPTLLSKRYGASIGIGACSGGMLLGQVSNTWESRKSNTFNGLTGAYGAPFQNYPIWEVFLTGSLETKTDLNATPMPTSQTSTPMSAIDALGNPTFGSTASWRVSQSVDQYSKTTSSSYYNDVGASWIVGRVTRTTVTAGVPYTPVNANYTRVSSFGYNFANGLLTSETTEPDRPTSGSERLDTSYQYDGFGNRQVVTVSGLGVNSRSTTTRYCANGQASAFCGIGGRFATYVQNAVGHVETRVFDARFGSPTQVTSPNGLTTSSSYDRIGRKFCETRPDGSTTGWTWSSPSGVAGGVYFATTTDSTGAATQQHFDALNREVATSKRTFDGGWATSTSGYDYRGRRVTTSKPYGDVTGTWTYTFDDLNRMKTEQGPGGYSATYAYNGLSTSTTVTAQSGSQTTARTSNNRGEVVSVLDARNSTLQLQYDPLGNLERKSVAVGVDGGSGATTLIYYNTRGQKTGMSDPDQGNWTYGYNAVGEMTLQVDGNSISTTFVYDNIGRVSQRTLNNTLNTTWTYDSCGQGSVGKLCRVADNKTARELLYDSKARLARTKVSLFDGRWYERFMTYDSMSRVRQIAYPITGFTLVHSYNSFGYMAEIDEPTVIGPRVIWKANSRFLDGQIKSESIRSAASNRTYDALGRVASIQTPNVQNSSFAFDAMGNLTSRSDTVIGMSETFTYDALNRLATVAGTSGARSHQYDSLGNLVYRSDIGSMTYRPGTHQLSQVGPVLYSYDPGGNLGSSPDFSRTISYWPNGKVAQVMQYPPGAPSQAKGYSYEYDADYQRSIEYRMQFNTSNSKTNYFFDGIAPFFEEDHDFDANGNRSLTWKHYVNTPEGVNQLVLLKNDAANTRIDRLLARDHLGSTFVVFGETSSNPEFQSFDAWGKRRDAAFQSPNPPTKTDRGFTGHEMMDDVGVINMNGRLYDPILGRMMQADPIVQAALNLQSYNRYSYVINNPLSLTDPTGYSWWTDNGRPAFRVVGAIVVSWFIGPGGYYGAAGAFGNSVVSGAAAGFAAGGIQGGNLNSALAGAVSGGVLAGINALPLDNWEKVGLAATAGGVMSKASGGRFASGFASVGFNAFVDLQLGSFDQAIHQAAFKAVTGGIAARLAGGKFSEGALTSATSAFITGTLGPGSEYIMQAPDELSVYQGLAPGRAVEGVRPLDNWLIHFLGDPMFLPTAGGWLEGTTFKLAHEAVFFRDSAGIGDNLGYSPGGRGAIHEGELVDGKPFNNMPVSSFRFNPRTFGVPFEIDVGMPLPGFESRDSYRFLGKNCQCFAKMFRYLGGP